MDFKTRFAQILETVNKWTDELSPKGDGLHKIIFEASNYSIQAGGKRIRPIIAYGVCEMLDGDEESVKNYACAVEFIHTYSLIHDDLPCMDDDDLRRGLPTNHKKFGEAIALLAGDSLLTYAFECASASNNPPKTTVKAINAISKAAGINGMIGGQVIDIEGAKTYDELKTVHKMKTGALIRLSAYLGAIAAGCDDANLKHIDEFADNLGIAFQIKDDILDVESTVAELGKPTGSDDKRGLTTYVTLFGIDGAKEKLEHHTKLAKDALSVFGKKAEFLLELSDMLLSRKN